MHAVLVLFRRLPNVGIQNFGMWGMYNFSESLQKSWKSIVNRRVEDWEASNGHTKDTTRLFHGPWHDAVGEHICEQPFRMWNRLRFHTFIQVSCHAQSTPKTIQILTKVFCTSGPNLVVLAQTGDELSHGQAQNGVNFDFEVKFDLEGQGQSPPKTIGILTKVFYTFGPILAILAWTGPELSRGQASDWRTDWHTHTHTQTHETWCGVLTDVAYQISWCGVLKFGTPHQKGVTFPDVAYGKIVFPDMA